MPARTIIKGGMFGILLLMLCLPILQQMFHIFPAGKLDGDVRNAPDTPLTVKTWWNSTYQEAKNDYLNDNMGLRTYLVRINNQVDYSLFKKLHAQDIVVGTDNYLYGKVYIDVHNGINYPGDSLTRQKFIMLKMLQDTFAHMGKTLIFLHAPSKAWYYAEHVPAGLRMTAKHTVYQDCLRFEDSLGINAIDFNALFLSMKDTARNLLMSKQGIHWTVYGSALAADTLIRYMEHKTSLTLPHIVIRSLEYSDSARSSDIDIARGLNLIFPVTREHFTYPVVGFDSLPGTKKINTIYIGDSFFWTILSSYIPHNFNKRYEFWYYFNEVYTRENGVESHDMINTYDWRSALVKTDVIVILSADINLRTLGHGFVDAAFQYYFPNRKI